MMLQSGDLAPDFSLPAHTGEVVTLSTLRGQGVVLYFYLRDNAPDCTKEALGFRDRYDIYQERGLVVLGTG